MFVDLAHKKYTLSWGLACIILFFGLCFPMTCFSWFSGKMEARQPDLPRSCGSNVESSNTYVLHYNTTGARDCGLIFPKPVDPSFVYANHFDVDIPLNLLLQETMDPVETVDRMIAVNLRIQEILEEYLAQSKKSKRLLNDLRIPYLEKREAGAKKNTKETIDPKTFSDRKERLKARLINTVKYEERVRSSTGRNLQASGSLLYTSGKKKTGSGPDISEGPDPDLIPDRVSRPSLMPLDVTAPYNEELPWFFSFVLSIFEYCMSHKSELVFWAVISVSGIFFTVALKVKQ